MKKNINLLRFNARKALEEFEKEISKRAYSRGFEVGAKSMETKTLGGKYKYQARKKYVRSSPPLE